MIYIKYAMCTNANKISKKKLPLEATLNKHEDIKRESIKNFLRNHRL